MKELKCKCKKSIQTLSLEKETRATVMVKTAHSPVGLALLNLEAPITDSVLLLNREARTIDSDLRKPEVLITDSALQRQEARVADMVLPLNHEVLEIDLVLRLEENVENLLISHYLFAKRQ